MNTKEIKITVPEGYEIDKENSTFECIKFKKKGLTYLNVHKALFGDGNYYYISIGGNEDVGINTTLAIHFDNNIANVEYIGVLGIEYSIMKEELIDALYAMIVKLKEEEII